MGNNRSLTSNHTQNIIFFQPKHFLFSLRFEEILLMCVSLFRIVLKLILTNQLNRFKEITMINPVWVMSETYCNL